MSRKSTTEPSKPGAPDAPQGDSIDHFDILEAQFFEQGQDGLLRPVDGEYFDDQGDLDKRKWFALSRQFFLGLAVGGVFGAVLFGVVAWRVPGPIRAATAEPVAAKQQTESPVSATAVKLASIGATQLVERAGPAGAAAGPDAAPQDVVAQVTPADTDTRDIGRTVEPAPIVADSVKPSVASAPQPSDEDTRQSCNQAIAGKQSKKILASCAEAFAANPSAADLAVVLAKIEFDHGRIAQAFEWSKKAIAADPNVADAYVFVGEAEQSAGHKQAARDAYAHYLRLAPSGRYATDLRAVLRSL